MIHIDRPQAPGFLLDPTKKWMKETNNAIAHYQSGKTDAFDFKEFNDTVVKDALKLVFKKCAYCETSYGAVYDGDVEHFRPKGRVSEKTPKNPGYFWLANDWDNLLLACQHCNQRRQHVLYGAERLEGYGKLDQFPLGDENKRAIDPADLAEEERVRLLLHPCKDDPENHLQYEREVGVIFSETPMGKASIKVYALQRPLLVQERQKMLKLLFKQMLRVKRELVRSDHDKSEAQKEIFQQELDDLLAFGDDTALYAGMCRYFLKEFLKENNIEIG